MRQVGVAVAVIVGVAAALPWLNKFANNLLLPCLSATPGAAAAAASSPASLRNVSRRALDARRDQGQCACCVSNLCHCRLRCAPLIHPLIIPLPSPSLCNPLAAAHPLLLLLYLGLYFCFFFSFCCCFPSASSTPSPTAASFSAFSSFFVCSFLARRLDNKKMLRRRGRKKIIYIIRTDVQNVGKSPAPFARLRLAWVVPLPLSAPSGRLGLVVDVLIVVLLLLLLLLRLLLLTLEPKGI